MATESNIMDVNNNIHKVQAFPLDGIAVSYLNAELVAAVKLLRIQVPCSTWDQNQNLL